MEIKKLEVQNFRSLKSINMGDLSSTNMIFGVNNSGKSNLFKFIQLFFSRKSIRTSVQYSDNGQSRTRYNYEARPFYNGRIYDEPFLFYENDKKKPISFDVVVQISEQDLPKYWQTLSEAGLLQKNDDHQNRMKFKGEIKDIGNNDVEMVVSSVLINKIEILNIDKHGRYQTHDGIEISVDLVTQVLAEFNDIVLLIPTSRHLSLEEPFVTDYDGPLTPAVLRTWLFNQYIQADTNKAFEEFTAFLSEIKPSQNLQQKFPNELQSFPFKNIELSFAKLQESIALMIKTSSGKYPAMNYGTGVQQFLFIMASLFYGKPKILLVEELELNLSLIYQQILIYILKEQINNGFIDQLFFSSHSDHFKRNDYKHYQVTINSEDGSQITSIDNPRNFFDKLANEIHKEN